MDRTKIIIMGAAGRDFHNFNVYFRQREEYEVVGFTATQIPGIAGRKYPASLAGELYPDGIPIYAESELERLIVEHGIEKVVFAYSDVSHDYVMHRASRVLSAGADFWLLGPNSTMLDSHVPVISVCATRTGSGKSQTTRRVVRILREMGKRVVSVRHPMPYGDLARQAVERFATYADLDFYGATIEEREEYEPHIDLGAVVFAGVDYERILREAEKEADFIVWDGGNNDFPFYRPGLQIVVVDPLRAGDELKYHPGETNLRMADVIVINKEDTASPEAIERVKHSINAVNPGATVIDAISEIAVENGEMIRGKRALVIEDGPSVTHGGMGYGAGYVAATEWGAAEIISPSPYAVGSIQAACKKYSQARHVLPALGYSEAQIKELEESIKNTPAEVVVIGTPVDLRRLVDLKVPAVRVRYELVEIGEPTLAQVVSAFAEAASPIGELAGVN